MFDAALAAAVNRAEPDIGKVTRGHIQQTEIVRDLFEGHYESVITVAEAFKDAVLGIGVAEAVDGEIVAFDGVSITEQVAAGTDFAGLTTLIDEVLKAAGQHHDHLVAAIRVDGTFTEVLLRSEPRQTPPYRPLTEVLDHEVQFAFGTWSGTMVGFSFPDVSGQVVIPGLHLHGVAADRNSGGHCHLGVTAVATLRIWLDDADIFVPMTGVHYGV